VGHYSKKGKNIDRKKITDMRQTKTGKPCRIEFWYHFDGTWKYIASKKGSNSQENHIQRATKHKGNQKIILSQDRTGQDENN